MGKEMRMNSGNNFVPVPAENTSGITIETMTRIGAVVVVLLIVAAFLYFNNVDPEEVSEAPPQDTK